MWLLTRAWIRYLVLFTQLDCFEQLLVNFYYHLIAVATGILYLTKDSSTIFSLIIGSCIFNAPTFLGLEGAADELDAGEDVNAAGQEHREALYPHAAVAAGFESVAHFCRSYRGAYGESPGVDRRVDGPARPLIRDRRS